jgi:hypothetical protein
MCNSFACNRHNFCFENKYSNSIQFMNFEEAQRQSVWELCSRSLPVDAASETPFSAQWPHVVERLKQLARAIPECDGNVDESGEEALARALFWSLAHLTVRVLLACPLMSIICFSR